MFGGSTWLGTLLGPEETGNRCFGLRGQTAAPFTGGFRLGRLFFENCTVDASILSN
jgi:hypothetical protein